jgi:hypothetical protein
LPEHWLVRRVRDPECSGYWLWPRELSEKPDARLELCSPAMPSWSADGGADDVTKLVNIRTDLTWRDRDVQLRLARQPDGAWFGYAEASYWPEHGAAQIAQLQFDHLKTQDLATLLLMLMAADLVPAPEITERTLTHRAFQEQCRRKRSQPPQKLEKLSVDEIAGRLEQLDAQKPRPTPSAGGRTP